MKRMVKGGSLSGLIGYRSRPSLPEICAFVAYLITAAALLFGRRTPDAVGLADPTRP